MEKNPTVADMVRTLIDDSPILPDRAAWAEQLGVSESAISQWFSQKTNLSAAVLSKIAQIVQTSPTAPDSARKVIDALLNRPADEVLPARRRTGLAPKRSPRRHAKMTTQQALAGLRIQEITARLAEMDNEKRDAILHLLELTFENPSLRTVLVGAARNLSAKPELLDNIDGILEALRAQIQTQPEEIVLCFKLAERLDKCLAACSTWIELTPEKRDRQAGQFLKNYRELRRQSGNFDLYVIEAQLMQGIDPAVSRCHGATSAVLTAFGQVIWQGAPAFPEAGRFLEDVERDLKMFPSAASSGTFKFSLLASRN